MTLKLIAFDLDGTLAESKQPLSSEMAGLLGTLLSRMPIAIMSGAAFAQYEKQFFPAFAPGADFTNLFIFPDNAAQCYVFKEGAWQARYDQSFTDEEKKHIMTALNQALADTKLKDATQKTWGPQIEDRGAQITFSALGQEAPLAEKQAWDSRGEKREALRVELAKRLPEFAEASGGLTSVDITRRGITKAYGVRQLSEMTGIPIHQMLYVGDALSPGGNDAVVIPTHIPTAQVRGPRETREILQKLLTHSAQEQSGI